MVASAAVRHGNSLPEKSPSGTTRRQQSESRQPAAADETVERRRVKDKVDVLITGAGASGAAAAWSLAETKMRLLCLEQGGWMKQSDYPSNGRDYEALLFSD
jgi:heterodisulfide reductase subunit A-like polyferredoxin